MGVSIVVKFLTLSIIYHTCHGSKLLLILMDGYRWDYFLQPDLPLPGFQRLLREGVRTERFIPDYPSLSYPNYYTIMTGLHAESHGMVSNYMYSEEHNETFWIGTNPEQYNPHWWDGAEPLWVTATKEGKRTYFYYWPGCEVTIRGVDPTFCELYMLTMIPEFQSSINATLQLLRDDAADVIGIYLEAPDKYGHYYGAKSERLNQMLVDIDKELSNLLGNLTAEGLDDNVNIMIFSDHGMANITGLIDFRNEINFDDLDYFIPEDTLLDFWPKEGKVDKVYNDLVALQKPNVTVYKKEDIPERYHYKNNPLIPPIIVVPDNGYVMCTDRNAHKCDPDRLEGHHGYDNQLLDMGGIFAAWGPAFKKGYVSPPIYSVDVYQIMTYILGIPSQPNNGTWAAVENMLVIEPTSSASYVRLDLLSLILLSIMYITSFLR